jgi:hypothetical protein
MDLRRSRRSSSTLGPHCCLPSSTNTRGATCGVRAVRSRMAKICSIVKFASSPTFHPHLGHHRILINSGQTWFRVDRHRRSFFEARPSVAQLSSSKALLSSSRGCDNLNAVHGMQWSSLLHAIVECTDPPKVRLTSMRTKIAFTPGLVGAETTNGGGGTPPL